MKFVFAMPNDAKVEELTCDFRKFPCTKQMSDLHKKMKMQQIKNDK